MSIAPRTCIKNYPAVERIRVAAKQKGYNL